MTPREKANKLLETFSSRKDAIYSCDEIIRIFEDQLPPLTSEYWKKVKEALRIIVILSELNEGDKVTFLAAKGVRMNGIVKKISGSSIWVVYRCDNDWNNYQNYTGQLSDVKDMILDWNSSFE